MISFGTSKTGAVSSTIVTFCVILDEFPDSSVAVHVTVVSPSVNELFVLLSNLTSLTESNTPGGNSSTCVLVADVASTIISVGWEIIGAVVSIIVTN